MASSNTKDESLADLNPEQRRAVETIDGALLIIAGAGSGKTRVITQRIARMLDSGIPQSQILALTFTNKAANEMAARVKELTGKKLRSLTVSTFHAFGARVLRADIEALGWRKNFSIYDETDKAALIRESARELSVKKDATDVYELSNLFSSIKTGRKRWDAETEIWKPLYESYQEGLKLYNAVDFDDLIMLPIKLFKENPDVLEKYKARYKYIMVDEFQDTSHQQYDLMRTLADKNVAVVGDDDQSIYSWRGADYKNITQFEKDFPGAMEIRLEQNYRSTETILEAANGVISHNTNRKSKRLWSAKREGKPIEIFMPEDETDEADFIAESVLGIASEERLKYDDFGILMRANSQGRIIEEALLEANIPYKMSGGTSFYERQEVKDIVSYLRVIANHDDDVNLLRVINTPRRGIGRSAIAVVSELSKATGQPLWSCVERLSRDPSGTVPDSAKAALADFVQTIEENRSMLGGRALAQKVRALVESIGYRDYIMGEFAKSEKAARFRLKNVETLLSSIETWENNPDNTDTSLFGYLNRITLLSRDDMDDDDSKGRVNLMTIHAAKGLEFPVVFIAGAEEGVMPHARAMEENGGDVEEERRLFYVAITRAKSKLIITSCKRRKKAQTPRDCEPSRFLDEIPANLVEYHKESAPMTDEQIGAAFESMKKKLSAQNDSL